MQKQLKKLKIETPPHDSKDRIAAPSSIAAPALSIAPAANPTANSTHKTSSGATEITAAETLSTYSNSSDINAEERVMSELNKIKSNSPLLKEQDLTIIKNFLANGGELIFLFYMCIYAFKYIAVITHAIDDKKYSTHLYIYLSQKTQIRMEVKRFHSK